MKTSKKLLFTDIDGTLLRSDQTISEETARLLSELASRGHGLILSSGRPLGSILKVYQYICSTLSSDFSTACIIANNGAQVYDCNSAQTILEKRIPVSLVDKLQEMAEAFGIHIQTYTDTNIVCIREDAETRSYVKRVILPVILSPRLSDALHGQSPYKMLALSLQGSETLMPFRQQLLKDYSGEVNCIFSGNGYLEIVRTGADKGNALQFLTEHLQIPIQNTYAAGDSENDLSMLAAAGHGYAMKNADKAIQQAAMYVTRADHNAGGINEILTAML